jgi:hypothetical protein
MKMNKKETIRIGSVRSEIDAARIYDFLAILTDGLNVSLSFYFLFFIFRLKLTLNIQLNNLLLSLKNFTLKIITQ